MRHQWVNRNFTKLRKYFLCAMKTKITTLFNNYLNNLLATFLSLDRIRILAVYGRVRELSDCIKNILICVPKMNEGLTGLEHHEGE